MKIIDQNRYQEVISKYDRSISDEPAVFVSDYASYNEGAICGAWFLLDDFTSLDEFNEKISEFFKELDKVAPLDFHTPREEIMFQDWQSIPDFLIGESFIHDGIFTWVNFISESSDNADLFQAYLDIIGEPNDIDDFISDIQDKFLVNLADIEYHGSDEEKFGLYFAEDLGGIEIPENIAFYFDYEAFGQDLLINDYCSSDGFIFTC